MRYLVPVRLKTSVGGISENTQRFLNKLGSSLYPKIEEHDIHICDVIAISNPRDLQEHEFVSMIMDTLHGKADPSQIILDIGGPNSETVLAHRTVGGVIHAVATLRDRFPETHILLAFPRSIDKNDFYYPAFSQIMQEDDKTSCFFYFSQSIQGKGHEHQQIRKTADLINTLYSRTLSNAQARLENKLVCHVGNFQINGSGKIIHDFYDGDFATEEIYIIVKELMEFLLKEKGPQVTVLYDDTVSGWFSHPFENAIREFEGKIIACKASDPCVLDGITEVDAILLPICRTGETFKRLLQRCVDNDTSPSPKDIYLWSLIDASGKHAEGDGSSKFKISLPKEDLSDAFVQSALRVSNRGSIAATVWNGYNFEPLDTSTIRSNLAREFSSDAMWALIFEAGLKEETDVPIRRDSIRFVPVYANLIQANGPLLAAKISAVLEGIQEEISLPNFAFIYPNQNAAELLAESVHDLSDYEAISISTKLIELASVSTSIDEILSRSGEISDGFRSEIGSEISLLQKRFGQRDMSTLKPLKVIALTEFYSSGGTIEGLYRVAKFFNWQMITDISLSEIPIFNSTGAYRRAQHTFYEFGND